MHALYGHILCACALDHLPLASGTCETTGPCALAAAFTVLTAGGACMTAHAAPVCVPTVTSQLSYNHTIAQLRLCAKRTQLLQHSP